MKQTRWLPFSLCALFAGCAQPQWPMEPPQKPTPPSEMAKLERLVGRWSFAFEMVSPSPEAMKAAMPEDAEPMPTTFRGEGTNKMVLGGMFLKGEGWYEMGEDQKANYVEYWTWNSKAREFRTFWFSDWGEYGSGTGKFVDENTIHMRFRGADADGRSKRGEGTQTFLDANTADWSFTERGPMGTIKMKGTARRMR